KPVDADQVLAAFTGEAVAFAARSTLAVPSLARVEWEHIQRVLADCGGNLSLAARLLGIHRRSLQRKLSKDPVPERR
ncbi:MAG: response regulator transcription factor, partial [Vicinamibacterales bacterium]